MRSSATMDPGLEKPSSADLERREPIGGFSRWREVFAVSNGTRLAEALGAAKDLGKSNVVVAGRDSRV